MESSRASYSTGPTVDGFLLDEAIETLQSNQWINAARAKEPGFKACASEYREYLLYRKHGQGSKIDTSNITREAWFGEFDQTGNLKCELRQDSNSQPPITTSRKGHIHQWLRKEGHFGEPYTASNSHGAPIGGLRILIQEWDFSGARASRQKRIAFDQETFEAVMHCFDLPKSYPYVFQNSDYYVSGLQSYPKSVDLVQRAIFQSPHFGVPFSLALSFNPEKSFTNVYLLCRRQASEFPFKRRIGYLLDHICHPLVLPLLYYFAWIQRPAKEDESAHATVNTVRDYLNLFEKSHAYGAVHRNPDFKTRDNDEGAVASQHGELAAAHFTVANTAMDFVSSLSMGIQESFKTLSSAAGTSLAVTDHQPDLEYLFKQLQGLEDMGIRRRKLITDKILFYQQALYFETNLIIANATKRDNASMKTIAALTFLFLPATAIASLFSMPFFSHKAGTGLQIAPDFSLYWKVVVPLTCGLFVMWIFWVRRDWIFALFNLGHGRARHAKLP